MVIRFGGGSNAGHTVVNDHGEFALHLIPCGIFNPSCMNVIGTGAVVDFQSLDQELDQLSRAGIDADNLRVSSRAHLVMPYHRTLDALADEARGSRAIGTTRRGVGPAYVDKANRWDCKPPTF
jgi:adenylosuccinate synthase